MLSKQQENHLSSIIEKFSEAYIKKYTAGALEHKGYLGDLSPLELAINIFEEAMDQVGYALTLIDQLQDDSEEE